jgi:hypothetical protein
MSKNPRNGNYTLFFVFGTVRCPLFSSNKGLVSLAGFQPPLIFTASKSFFFAILFSFRGKPAAGKNKTNRPPQVFQLFDFCEFYLEFLYFI